MSSLFQINYPVISHDITTETQAEEFQDLSYLPENPLHAQLLNDKSRLQEIYDLRVNVWESEKNDFVNRRLYPNGWQDELDQSAFHWIVSNDQDQIIASARLNIFNSLKDFPYYASVKYLPFPQERPFAFYSRLVVHAQYRQSGLSRKLFNGRKYFCDEKGIHLSQVFINNRQVIGQFEKSGYKNIGQAEVNYHAASRPHSVNVFIKDDLS